MEKVYKLVVLIAVALPMMTGCGPSSEETAMKAATDSMAAARARGETDLGNPEMGAKMVVELADGGMTLSHTEIPGGQVTVAVMNKGTKPRIFEMKGPTSNVRSMLISPGGHVLLSSIMELGVYDLACPDSTGERHCGSGTLTVK